MYCRGVVISSRVTLEFIIPSFRLNYITKISQAEIQYDFNIQRIQEKMLGTRDVYKIHVSELLKFLLKYLPIVIY